MTPEQLEVIVQHLSGTKLALDPTAYAVVVALALVGSIAGSYAGAYLSEKGKNLATRDDLQHINDQLRTTTKTTEEVKAQVSGAAWLKQQVWGEKRKLYVEILQQLQTMKNSAQAAATLATLGPPFESELKKSENAYNGARSRVGELVPAGFLLLSKESRELLNRFPANVTEALAQVTAKPKAAGKSQTWEDLGNAVVPPVDTLINALLKSARTDLGIDEI